MEYEIKTIVCPNCGANATNHQNCEYCGSMLVRCYEMMDIDEDSDEEDIKGVLKLFGKSAYTNKLLCERVKKIIYLSEKHQTEIIGDFYAYNYAEMGRYSTVSDTDADEDEEMDTCIPWHNVLTVKSNPQSNTLTLVVKFNMQSEYQNSCFVNFEDRTFCKFFNLEQDDSIMLCSMEIDKNEITAAKFIKYIIEELFYWKDNKYECRIFGSVDEKLYEFIPKENYNFIKKFQTVIRCIGIGACVISGLFWMYIKDEAPEVVWVLFFFAILSLILFLPATHKLAWGSSTAFVTELTRYSCCSDKVLSDE